MSESKKAMGKLYEKYEILKGHTHSLEVAIAHNSLTEQDELVIVWANPEDKDQKMPLAQLLTGTEIERYLEPDFEKSFVLEAAGISKRKLHPINSLSAGIKPLRFCCPTASTTFLIFPETFGSTFVSSAMPPLSVFSVVPLGW